MCKLISWLAVSVWMWTIACGNAAKTPSPVVGNKAIYTAYALQNVAYGTGQGEPYEVLTNAVNIFMSDTNLCVPDPPGTPFVIYTGSLVINLAGNTNSLAVAGDYEVGQSTDGNGRAVTGHWASLGAYSFASAQDFATNSNDQGVYATQGHIAVGALNLEKGAVTGTMENLVFPQSFDGPTAISFSGASCASFITQRFANP